MTEQRPRQAPEATEIDRLIAAMTVRERVGQLNQRLYGWHAVERRAGRWRVSDLLRRELERWSGLGAIYGLLRADAWSGRSWADGIGPEDRLEVVELVQAAVRDASPHGLGVLVVEDAPHGHLALGSSLLPTNLAMAATWNPDLIKAAAASVASELSASGVDLAMVSGLDLLRDARWGRSEECFGEDPLLSAQFVAAVVTGMQGENQCRVGGDGVGVILKHLAGQGEAVGGRNGQSAVIGERDLREIHLPAAAAGVAAGAIAVMAAYNDIDGIPCHANPWLLRHWLRDEQGFAGLVMADGGAIDRLEAITGSIAGAGRLALLSGVDISLWDEGFTTLTETAEHDKDVLAAVDRSCLRVLATKHRLGLLARRAVAEDNGPRRERIDLSRHMLRSSRAQTAALSRTLAAEALVLLDNAGGVLPLDRDHMRHQRILLVGPYAAEHGALLGDYVPPLPDGDGISVLQELESRLPCSVSTADWSVPGAVEQAADEADLIIAVVGGTSERSYGDTFANTGAATSTDADCGEGVDRAELDLPHLQSERIASIRRSVATPMVAVVVAGRPYILTDIVESCDATLWAGYPGPAGAAAVVDGLLGIVEPSGQLPFTLLREAGAGPVHYNDRHEAGQVYGDAPQPVLREFGFAETYRERVQITQTRAELDHGGNLTVAATVSNMTTRPGSRILTVTAHRRGGPAKPRRRELIAFRRISVAPGTTATVTLLIPHDRVFATDGTEQPVSTVWLSGCDNGGFQVESPRVRTRDGAGL